MVKDDQLDSTRPVRFLSLGWGIAAAILLLACASNAVAQPATGAQGERAAAEPGVSTAELLRRRGDLTLSDATLEGALFTISKLWGVNVVAGEVQGEVNGVFKDAPLREILDSILLSNGYAYRTVGDSLVVSRMEELGQVNPFFVTETIPVGAASSEEVVSAASLLNTPQGKVQALPSAGAILVVDFPDRVAKIRALVRQIDGATRSLNSGGAGPAPQQLEVAYFRTHFLRAVDAQAALAPVLSEEGRISALDGEDRLLVVDYAENVSMIEAVLARLDRPRPQVRIRSLIYDIALTDAERLGFNWDGITNGTIDDAGVATGENSGLRFLTQTLSPLTAADTGGQFTFFTFDGGVDIRAVAIALQEAQDSRLLADPNVVVSDNEQARIESITEVPFQQLTQTSAGGQIGTTSFREAGVKLDVRPKIARDGTIRMTVVPEFSRVAGFTPGDNQPILETRRATTDIRVRNGQTAMIAGLRQRSDVGEFDGVPYLKDVRFLGHLFRARDTQIIESELVVFLTPEIVGYADPLGHREQLTSDTIDCRLERIPAAEGCPSGCGPCDQGVYGPYEVDSPTGPATLPLPTEAVRPAAAFQDRGVSLQQTSTALSQPRRLPPIDGRIEPAAATDADLEGQAVVAAPDPLRPDYETRFRATGGVYPGQQRVEPQPSEEPAEEESRSWWNRLFRRGS